jgi:plastocyanin
VLVSFNLGGAKLLIAACVVLFSCSDSARAQQQSTVTIRAVIQDQSATKQDKADKGKVDASDVVMWLKPLDQKAGATAADALSHKKWQLVQHHKMFQPHVLVVPVGAVVEFPNRDPFFHNVFSLFDGKRFDLGLYEAGATNSVRFDRLGVSFLFCNIHSDMSAVVVAVDTNYFAISGRNGYISIANVPEGKYELHVWYERSLPEDLKSLTRVVTISSPTTDLGAINVRENPSFSPSHKNKYGQDYTPPPAPSYSHP